MEGFDGEVMAGELVATAGHVPGLIEMTDAGIATLEGHAAFLREVTGG